MSSKVSDRRRRIHANTNVYKPKLTVEKIVVRLLCCISLSEKQFTSFANTSRQKMEKGCEMKHSSTVKLNK